ncbi:hypothetical protein T440DRAFT_268344 [Plenodomus tracheiphilus IPT5]|uniref:Uncharacterized protein n=1 Tax=Plenodomus tracheiphilus IPT5 TaxID=1408161 RepID=A0A6A7BFS1_9PLEO|nr:hypothetical protein T440DRAFT_268344 [Plenodomus tracheiphilus IPT5]
MPPAAYPWDSHQDAVVNSTELPGPQPALTGIAHYRQVLQTQRTYPRICTDFVADCQHTSGRGTALNATLNLDDATHSTRHSAPDPSITYATRPVPPPSHDDYTSLIYYATTTHTPVCLSIIRIAEKNLPFLSFTSATSHLPNLAPSDPLPPLPRGTFTGDIPYSPLPTDVTIYIAFLPEFYEDMRHALGYYVLSPENMAEPVRHRITACVFTPCTTRDLEDWDLVLYLEGEEEKDIHGMDVVGVKGGEWLDPVDDEAQWGVVWWVLERWEKRVRKSLLRLVGG